MVGPGRFEPRTSTMSKHRSSSEKMTAPLKASNRLPLSGATFAVCIKMQWLRNDSKRVSTQTMKRWPLSGWRCPSHVTMNFLFGVQQVWFDEARFLMFYGLYLIDMAYSGGFSIAASLVDSKRDNE